MAAVRVRLAGRQPGEIGVDQLNSLQDWMNTLDPKLAFLLMSSVFLVASTTGWYVARAASVRLGRRDDRR